MCVREKEKERKGGRIHSRRGLKSTVFFPDIGTCLFKLRLNIKCNTCACVVLVERRIKLPKPLLCLNLLLSSGIQNELSSNLVPLYSPLRVTQHILLFVLMVLRSSEFLYISNTVYLDRWWLYIR